MAEAHGFKKWPQRQLVGLDNLMEQARNDKSLTAAGREVRQCGCRGMAHGGLWGVAKRWMHGAIRQVDVRIAAQLMKRKKNEGQAKNYAHSDQGL